MLFSGGYSLAHELVHAVLDSEGESYFVEEGMAEMFSGVGVYYDVEKATVSPTEHLRLSRLEYRTGGLDYDAAAHFVRWVYETAGPSSMLRLATKIEARSSASEIAGQLESVFAEPMESIEARYRTTAPNYYPGLAHGTVQRPSWSELHDGLRVSLSCGQEDTRGPLPSGEAGMYRVLRVDSDAEGLGMISVDGPPGAFVELIDPHARIKRGVVQDWTRPNSEIDPNAVRIGAGETVLPQLKRRTYLVVVGVTDVEAADVVVTMTPPPGRSGQSAPERPVPIPPRREPTDVPE
ncbi:MAG: hypothetical protein AAF721_19485 [Myxococcota bacterium]